MFFIFFFHFSEEKGFFFSFFLVFLSIFFAGNSIRVKLFPPESVLHEMWCPDDIGRDSLDWVGPPAWERA